MRASEKSDVEKQIEAHRRVLQVLENKEAMEGIYDSLRRVQKGERGTPGKDLKRKYKRA